MQKILVTGGAGFIGSHLVDRLCAQASNRIVVLDNLKRGRLGNLAAAKGKIQFTNGDIRDRATLENLMRNVDVVYHLAAQSNVLGAAANQDYSFTTNVNGTFEVLRAAAANHVKRLVFTSSREVYGEQTRLPVPETASLQPKNDYGASKAAGEMYCTAFNSRPFQVRILRLANVYGLRDFDRVIPIFANQSIRGEPLTLFGGNQIIDFVSVDHVVEGLIRAAEADSLPSPINIGTGKATNLRELATRIIAAAGSASKLLTQPAREIEVTRFTADTRLQKEHLGLESPKHPLNNLQAVVESLRPETFSHERAVAAAN